MKKYVISDLHGRLDLFKEIYKKLKEDDVLYILGDTIDRGTFEDVMEIYTACMSDKRIIHTLGNHEDMCITIFKNLISEYSIHGINSFRWLDITESELDLWSCNGGYGFIKAIIDGRVDIDDLVKLNNYFKSLPIIVEDEGYVLSHAGVDKDIVDLDNEYDRDFVLWNITHEELLPIKQVVGHVIHKSGVVKLDDIVYVDTSNFKNKLGVFELIEEKLFEIEIKED